jgi:hypothetical protein
VNIELLKKVRKFIADEPRRLNMGEWGRRKTPCKVTDPPCDTVACLAGWTVLASKEETEWDGLFVTPRVGTGRFLPASTEAEAARLLGESVWKLPFWRTEWGVPEVLAWIDAQIAGEEKP